jgi:hypothetical protein
MSKQLIIDCSKCKVVLFENEFFKGLNPELLAIGLRRGKGYCRALANEKREAKIDRWQLCSWLKGYRIPDNAANLIESMGVKELREGCIEYLLMKSRTKQIDDN